MLAEVAANTDPDQVNSHFTRPDAREFRTRHNPVDVVPESLWGDITFYPFAALDDQQIGYAIDGRTGEAVADWPPNMLVVADCGGNPIMLDPSVEGEVFFAIHGMGSWDPQPVAKDISGFFKLLIAWLETSQQRGEGLYDETYELDPDSLALFRDLAAAQCVDDRYIRNAIALR
ncbi:SMI1/KNR4 family protein [Paracoccus sp. 11-3]|uniref:SMI1/KNR4 family protein n=1 Tax=Paracoccus amoyensis TaxID=2760093 RepID=A0A926G5T8_9RHOB|nr:SMI1/KNR4 family protein [Paracoccus amoyensis]MBC9246328.1 SMI1/KNR4 family protein [Paracoccus amoyensis]